MPLGDFDAVVRACGPETAGILIEPIQGEVGVRVPPPGFLKRLREFCDARGLLLVFDEVQTGMGRTGRLFAYEEAGLVPDIMAVGKGIGGGFPLGACLASERAAKGMTVGSHGSTYGGNPLAMAAGNAVLDIVLAKPEFLERVRAISGSMQQHLAMLAAEHPNTIAEVRGHGLLLGLKLHVPAAAFHRAAAGEPSACGRRHRECRAPVAAAQHRRTPRQGSDNRSHGNLRRLRNREESGMTASQGR